MGKLFGGGAQKAPEPTPVTRMPDPEAPDVKAAEERRRREIMARSGRTSTMLSRGNSGSGSGAGTGAYGNSLLGQGG